MSLLYMGHCDAGCVPAQRKDFLKKFHNIPYSKVLRDQISFRDDDRSAWRKFKEARHSECSVFDINTFLHQAGFMPRQRQTPVFDYVTQASVRLFQEYVRTVEGVTTMLPDGMVGNQTYKHMKRWQSDKRFCHWVANGPSDEYTLWMQTLQLAKQSYGASQPSILRKVAEYPDPTDTRKLDDWSFESNDIHLVGIRSGEHESAVKRDSDDLFILLVNGMVFKFWGSTDPSATMAGIHNDEAFLSEGQHKYRFSWHKISSENKVYRALRPYKNGVLVLRDRDQDNALTFKDVNAGFDQTTNHTINIHWSGIGASNWSAGCQVIAGKSYINTDGNVIDCSEFAAFGYKQLNSKDRRTKAAYNMLTDLVLCYAAPSVDYLLYSLGRDESFNLTDAFDSDYVKKTFLSMRV